MLHKNTAFIKGMFNSNLEVSKFMGAKIKTVSGIRGQIKKPVKGPREGNFRAIFEDKVLMSDIVFCRTWYTIKLDKFINPISSFNEYKLAKTTWQLRMKYGIKAPQNNNYKEVERPNKKFTPLVVPKRLQSSLPFATRDKVVEMNKKVEIEKRENQVVKALSTDKEKEVRYMVQRLKLIQKEKKRIRKVNDKKKKEWKEKWDAGMNKNLKILEKQRKKDKYKKLQSKKGKSN